MRHFLPPSLLNDLHPVSIDLIGLGGTGSRMLTALAQIDFALKHFERKGLIVTAYDSDTVSEANLGRQLNFSASDVNKNKAQVLIDRCNRQFGLEWNFNRNNYPLKSSIGANIIISCVDNVKTRYEIAKRFTNSKCDEEEYYPHYFMDFGNNKNCGQVILGTFNEICQPYDEDTVGKLPHIVDKYPYLKDDISTPSCSLAEALESQDLFINASLIPFGATILWNLLKNFCIYEHGAIINLSTLQTLPIIVTNEKIN